MKLNKVIAIPALALTAGLSLAACGSSAPAAVATVTASPAPTTPAATTPAAPAPAQPAPAKTVYVPVPAAPAAPAGPALTNCGGDVFAGPDTSCPFALNVAEDYTGLGADYAYSPVTGLNYTMTCTEGVSTVVCTGGDNAYVQWNAS
jgi:serine/threonine kinase PknH